jgi:hypothetical protein
VQTVAANHKPHAVRANRSREGDNTYSVVKALTFEQMEVYMQRPGRHRYRLQNLAELAALLQ